MRVSVSLHFQSLKAMQNGGAPVRRGNSESIGVSSGPWRVCLCAAVASGIEFYLLVQIYRVLLGSRFVRRLTVLLLDVDGVQTCEFVFDAGE